MHPLQQRLVDLRRRVRRLVALWGASRLVALVLAPAIALALADYVVRFEDTGIRVINSLVLAGLAAWACYRYAWGSLAARWADLQLAAAVERRFPVLGDRLGTAIDFLGRSDDDVTAGSAELRGAVVAQTAADAAGLDFAAVVNPAPAVRAAIGAIAVVLAAAVLVAVDPAASRTALARLLSPLGSTTWPQRTHLVLRHRVEEVARGQAFEIEVLPAPGTALPSEVRVHYRFARPDRSAALETERLRSQGKALMARRQNVTQPFSYRVEGGDDRHQPWIDVKIIEPPEVKTFSVHLTPPDYTGWTPYDANKQIRALAGTRAEFRGAATKPLASAELLLDDARAIAGALVGPAEFQAPRADAAPFLLERSGAYSLALVDRQGISNLESERGEIRIIPDAPPSASLEQPADSLFVTPRGTVPLRVTAKDDLAVAAIDLVFQPADQDGEKPQRVTIYRGPPRPPPQAAFSPAPAMPPVEYRWDLASLGLARGAIVVLHVEARDYAGAVGRSASRRLVVVGAEELLERIAERQSRLAAGLERVLKTERETRTRIAGLQVRLSESGRLEQLDVDHLQAAALGHRQAERALSEGDDSAAAHVRQILADVENNRLAAPDVTRRMETLLAAITELNREALPRVDQQLTAAIKSAQTQRDQAQVGSDDRRRLAGALAHTLRGLDQVLASLDQMAAQLGQWESYRRLYRELAEMVRQQEELARQGSALAPQTIGRELKDLLPQQAAELRILASGQLELSLRLDQLQDEMGRTAQRLAANDPTAAGNLAQAAEESGRRALGVRMRQVRAALDDNQMGRAVQGQKRLVDDLAQVLAILSGQAGRDSARLMERLADAAAGLRARQQELLDQTRAAAPTDALAGRQRALGEETGQWADKLGPASAFGLLTREAASDMLRAAGLLERRQAGQPTLEAQQSAVQRLSMLLQALAAPSAAPPAGQGPNAGDQKPPGAKTISVSELRLLRLMQEDILARTRQLDESAERSPARYSELSQEQGRLLDMVRRLQESQP